MRQHTIAMVPAFNEQAHIANVVAQLVACRAHGCVDEVLVVDDGSTDATAALARAGGAAVYTLAPNRGKAWAVAAGAHWCRARGTDTLLMLDADLAAILPHQLDALLAPLASAGGLDMTVGTVQGDLAGISGQRAIRLRALQPLFSGSRSWGRKLFLTGYGLEVALNHLLPRHAVVDTGFTVARLAEGKHLGVRDEVDATHRYIGQRTALAALLRRLRAGHAALPADMQRSANRHRRHQVRRLEQRLFEAHAGRFGPACPASLHGCV